MTARGEVRTAVSAGGVVWRQGGDRGLEIVLCGRSDPREWGLPKGTPQEGESMEQAALREVAEETGLRVTAGARLGTIRYWFVAAGVRYHKKVHFWLMKPHGGDFARHDHEFDEVRWVPIADARTMVKFPNERRILDLAARAIEGAR